MPYVIEGFKPNCGHQRHSRPAAATTKWERVGPGPIVAAWDSYPSGLGRKIIKDVPKDPAEFSKWKAKKERWLDDLYAAEQKRYTAISLQPTNFVLVPAADVQQQDSVPEPVYAEYFGRNDYDYDPDDQRASNAWSEFPPEDHGELEYLYVIDLDRDAFSVDLRAHFRLSNLPEDWLSHLKRDEDHYRIMPTDLAPDYLAWNVFAPEPVYVDSLVRAYRACEVTQMESPKPPPRQWLKRAIMLKLAFGLTSMLRNVLENTWREYSPTDVRMQKIIYALVKCCCWESLSFEPTVREWNKQEVNVRMGPYATALFHVTAFPRGGDYFIPVGDEKVLISITTHLEQHKAAEMAISRVIEMVRDGEKQTACIVSLRHVIIVKIDKSRNPSKVTCTERFKILDELDGWKGAEALIATLSTFPSTLAEAPCPDRDTPTRLSVPPLEIVERIFKWMSIMSPASISNFALACKQFAAIVRDNTIRFPGCTLFPYAPRPSHRYPCVAGVDHNTRELGIYYVAGEIDGGFHIKMYDHLGFAQAGLYDLLGPRRDFDILVDGSKSGLFGLNLSLCEFDEGQGCYGPIWLRYKASEPSGPVPLPMAIEK